MRKSTVYRLNQVYDTKNLIKNEKKPDKYDFSCKKFYPASKKTIIELDLDAIQVYEKWDSRYRKHKEGDNNGYFKNRRNLLMSNNHGGKRMGAGRKKQDTVTKVLNGTAATAELPAFSVNAELRGAEMPKPNEYLTKETRQVSTANRGKEIYERLWNWLKERDCHLLVNPESLQQYALSLSRCEQAENAIHDYGFLAKHPTTQMPCESPYVRIAQKYQKQAQGQWSAIEVNIAERLRYFVDKNAGSNDPLDIILNRAVDKAGR